MRRLALLGLVAALVGADGPDPVVARRLLGAARAEGLGEQGNARAAILSYERQLQNDPGSIVAQVGLGRALARVGRCAEALARLLPNEGTGAFSGEAYLASGSCASRLGDVALAIRLEREAAERLPESAKAWTLLALDLAAAGDARGAEEALSVLSTLRPDRDASRYARAVLALRAGDLDAFDWEAFTWERDDGPSADLRLLQAQAWLDTGAPGLAVAALSRVIQIRGAGSVRVLRAEALRRTGALREAEQELADRPLSVLEGASADAVRARVAVDRGDLGAARAALAPYDGVDDAEIAASAWYLARAAGRAADLPALEAAYGRLERSRLRRLDQLTPW